MTGERRREGGGVDDSACYDLSGNAPTVSCWTWTGGFFCTFFFSFSLFCLDDDDDEVEEEEDETATCSASWQKVFFFLFNDVHAETTGRRSD